MLGSKHLLFLFFIATVLFACSATKSVPQGDRLYTGAQVKLEAPAALTAGQRKVLRTDLARLTRPRPNSRFLGIPFKLYVYNMFAGAKENSFFGNLRNKLGQPPVLFSDVDLEMNNKVLQNYLDNKGFFSSRVTGDTIVKKKKAHAEYLAVTGPQTIINTVSFPADSSDLGRAIAATAANSLLKPGEPFDLDLIKGERLRIDAYLKEHGFYYFSPDYILVKADTSIGDKKVNMHITVKDETPTVATEIFRINDVYIYSNYNLNTAGLDTNKANSTVVSGFYVIDKADQYKPYLFDHSMQFRSGDVYNRTDHNATLNRLINLNLFKFVKNRFEVANWVDSPYLDVFYYLTPMPKKTLRAEITGTTKSNNYTGSEITFNWRNRNIFRGGEMFGFNFYVGSEVQRSGTLQGFNTYTFGAEANLSKPRFLIPFVDIRNEGAYAPRTNLKLGYDVLNKRQLYTLNSFRFGYGYIWKKNIRRNNELYPISINYVQPLNQTPRYRDSITKNPQLARATERQLILGSTYQFTYNDLLRSVQPPKSFFLNGLIDLSGNIAGLITGANIKKGDTVFIRGVPFSQYIKLEGDARYYFKFWQNNIWANRIILGYGLPYGNSYEMPFIKQFFVGGNNSVRAFRSRSVGPGTYRDPNYSSEFLPDQTGDIKLEINTELRPRISGPLYGAIFLDAGNVWLKNVDPDRPGAEFNGKFLSQLAVGAGVGLRLDVTIFVIRFDVAIPLRKPWEQNPWVMNQITFKEKSWRQDNIMFNLAIGYPF